MKTSTILIINILIIIAFIVVNLFSARRNSLKDHLDKAQLKVLKHERDSFQKLTIESRVREQQYVLRIEKDSIKGDSLVRIVAIRESKIKSYKLRLDEISRVTIAQPDSFLIRRYPQ